MAERHYFRASRCPRCMQDQRYVIGFRIQSATGSTAIGTMQLENSCRGIVWNGELDDRHAQLLCCPRSLGVVVGPDDQCASAQIAQVELVFLRAVRGIQRRACGGARHRQESGRQFWSVRQDDGDAVVAADAQGAEPLDDASDVRPQKFVGERRPARRSQGDVFTAAGSQEIGECAQKSIDDRCEGLGVCSPRVTSRRSAHMERDLPRRDIDPPVDQPTSILRVAWIMSRFPRLTETFVLYEILAAEALGLSVDVYPLLRERARVVHPEAEELLGRVRYTPFMSRRIIASQMYWLVRAPRRYLGALWAVVRGTWGSANFFLGGLATFPKVAHMARGMRANSVEHVHCHFANHPALAGFVIQRLTGITYSFTTHGSDVYVDRHMLRRKVAEAAFVVAVSDYVRRLILDECEGAFHDKVRVVHCGVDMDVFVPDDDRVVSADLSILCVATLSPWKGQEQLIEACRLLTERGVQIRCLLVGGAGDREALQRRIVDAGVADRVQITHWKTRPEVARLIRGADVVVAPSVQMPDGKQEGIPVTLMEAMASGTPVVASRLGGIPELIEHEQTGLLVAPADPAGLAEALERLHASPELRRRLAEAGRARVLRDFELRSNAAEVVGQIKAVARRGS